jgi:hypothetical protein
MGLNKGASEMDNVVDCSDFVDKSTIELAFRIRILSLCKEYRQGTLFINTP